VAEALGDPGQHPVGLLLDLVLGHAEHELGAAIVRRQLGLPVGEVAPRWGREHRVGRDVERVGVDQRAAADARSRQHEHVRQKRQPQDAEALGGRHPQRLAQVPVGAREVGRRPPPTALEDAHRVALLGQAQGRHRTTEARADDHEVVVEAVGHLGSVAPPAGAA
jgi:hypothetical protein